MFQMCYNFDVDYVEKEERNMEYYLRGQIAKMAGINVETLRYYEKIKLIPTPNRTENGYRVYSKDILLILGFIKSAKSAGFTLEQIRMVFSVVDGKKIDLDYIEKLINIKVVEIGEKIIELQNMKENLKKIKDNLHHPHECPLLNSFKNNL